MSQLGLYCSEVADNLHIVSLELERSVFEYIALYVLKTL